jgi:3-methyladenine DNA glycosylase AlkD
MENITQKLLSLGEAAYKDFSASLMPTVDKNTVIGIRVPKLKKYAKQLTGTKEAEEFTQDLPHKYFEENNLHSFLICNEKDFQKQIELINAFLPYVDNWATCDGMRPVSFEKNKPLLLPFIEIWLKSKHPYTVRFAILMLMVLFLDDDFNEKHLEMVSSVKSDEYYVNMMIAWYFATALAKQWDASFPYIKENKLPHWVHNKTIQKARESFRISSTQKDILTLLKKNIKK